MIVIKPLKKSVSKRLSRIHTTQLCGWYAIRTDYGLTIYSMANHQAGVISILLFFFRRYGELGEEDNWARMATTSHILWLYIPISQLTQSLRSAHTAHSKCNRMEVVLEAKLIPNPFKWKYTVEYDWTMMSVMVVFFVPHCALCVRWWAEQFFFVAPKSVIWAITITS